MCTLCQTFVLSAAVKGALVPSVEQPPTNFYLCNKIFKCICIKYVTLHIIIHQHVSIAFAIIRVAFQEYKEFNNLQ